MEHIRNTWEVEDDGRVAHVITLTNEAWVVVAEVEGDADIRTANARLIAAAPELLAALKDLYQADVDQADPGLQMLALEKARAAIAKAT